jgi:hypothetical protein
MISNNHANKQGGLELDQSRIDNLKTILESENNNEMALVPIK